jgi:predicted ATP-dependent endonuclease of OLD family
MLDKIRIENFTVFDKVQFQFGTGINVIIGDNGTGKSHLLKLAYTISTVAAKRQAHPPRPTCKSKLPIS